MTRKQKAATAAVLTLAAGMLLYLATREPAGLQVVATVDGFELSWTGEMGKFYRLSHATNPAGPWAEFWRGEIVAGTTIDNRITTNLSLTLFPATPDFGSREWCGLSFEGVHKSPRVMVLPVTVTNYGKHFFRLWTSVATPPVEAATLRINR